MRSRYILFMLQKTLELTLRSLVNPQLITHNSQPFHHSLFITHYAFSIHFVHASQHTRTHITLSRNPTTHNSQLTTFSPFTIHYSVCVLDTFCSCFTIHLN